jgi:probable rRNA maturation factor
MVNKVHFFFEGITKFNPGKNLLNDWILQVVSVHGQKLKSLRVVFCSDDFLLELNKKYLQHNTFTDIITFPYSNPGEALEGELYISTERVKDNALSLDTEWLEELHRVIIHGVLHLLGYNDHTDAEKDLMRSREDYCLSLRAL